MTLVMDQSLKPLAFLLNKRDFYIVVYIPFCDVVKLDKIALVRCKQEHVKDLKVLHKVWFINTPFPPGNNEAYFDVSKWRVCLKQLLIHMYITIL